MDTPFDVNVVYIVKFNIYSSSCEACPSVHVRTLSKLDAGTIYAVDVALLQKWGHSLYASQLESYLN